MSWRFGLHDSTFEPLWSTHWALLVVLLLPTLIGLLGAWLRPARMMPVLLACTPVLVAGLWMVMDAQQAGVLRWQWQLVVVVNPEAQKLQYQLENLEFFNFTLTDTEMATLSNWR